MIKNIKIMGLMGLIVLIGATSPFTAHAAAATPTKHAMPKQFARPKFPRPKKKTSKVKPEESSQEGEEDNWGPTHPRPIPQRPSIVKQLNLKDIKKSEKKQKSTITVANNQEDKKLKQACTQKKQVEKIVPMHQEEQPPVDNLKQELNNIYAELATYEMLLGELYSGEHMGTNEAELRTIIMTLIERKNAITAILPKPSRR